MIHPETDQDFRERILQVVRDEPGRRSTMTAIGAGLDAIGRMNGLARKGLPEGSFTDPVVEGFKQVEIDLAQTFDIPSRMPDETEAEFLARARAYWGLPS